VTPVRAWGPNLRVEADGRWAFSPTTGSPVRRVERQGKRVPRWVRKPSRSRGSSLLHLQWKGPMVFHTRSDVQWHSVLAAKCAAPSERESPTVKIIAEAPCNRKMLVALEASHRERLGRSRAPWHSSRMEGEVLRETLPAAIRKLPCSGARVRDDAFQRA